MEMTRRYFIHPQYNSTCLLSDKWRPGSGAQRYWIFCFYIGHRFEKYMMGLLQALSSTANWTRELRLCLIMSGLLVHDQQLLLCCEGGGALSLFTLLCGTTRVNTAQNCCWYLRHQTALTRISVLKS